MPNHCLNILDVTGQEEEVERFRNAVMTDKQPLSFERTRPSPPELHTVSFPCQSGEEEKQAEFIKKYGAGNWYDWSRKNWGTKWDAYDVRDPEEIDEGLRFIFSTAWCPPVSWLEHAASLYPRLTFTLHWEEEDAGRVTFCFEEGIEEDIGLSPHEFKMQFNEDYRSEYEFITTGDYKEVRDKYLEHDDLYEWPELDKFLLDRLEQRDLPLFIQYEWGSLEDKFREKLKGN